MENPYRHLSRSRVYQNRLVTVYEDRLVLPDGTESAFCRLDITPGVLVLALTQDREVWMVREFKYGLQRASLELIGGAVDPGEDPLDTAKRELREEASLSAARWTGMGVVDPFPTFVESPNTHFLAEDLQSAPHQGEPNEVLELVKVPFEHAIEMVMANEVKHAPSCVLILKVAEILRRR